MAGLVGWFGGKNTHSPWIYSFIPKEIDTYIEPFSGSFPIYFNEDFSHVKNIVFNDTNKFQVNLMQCSKQYDLFLSEIDLSFKPGGTLYCDKFDISDIKKYYRDLFTEIKDPKKSDFYDNLNFQIPDFERGVIYAFMITSSFNACFARGAGFSGFTKTNKLKLTTLINKLQSPKYREKLDNLNFILNEDFESIFNQFDSPNSFFYCDPPYKRRNYEKGTHNIDYGSQTSFGESGHERLRDILYKTKSKWILSYYWFPELEEWFPKSKYRWESKEFFRSSSSFSENKTEKGIELLIMNF